MSIANTMDKVLSTLEGVDPQECRRVMVDYDSFINKVQHEDYVQTFIDLFRKNEEAANKALSDAELREFVNGNVADISKKIPRQLFEN